MHDVTHVVAVSIAEGERMFNIPNVANVKKKMEETMRESPIAISLPYRDIQELRERLQCPRLQLFLLFTQYGSSFQTPDPFFEVTEELKVLSLTGIHFSSLPSSLGHLINLQTLCLDWFQLEDVAVVGKLNKLEILSLRYSKIKQLPHEIGQLTQLQLLDLSDCWRLEVIAPNVISKLSRLEELYMDNSFSQWKKFEGGSNASLVELKEVIRLTTLEIHVQDADILPLDLVNYWTELQRYSIRIGEVPHRWSFESGISRLMKLRWSVEQKFSVLLENYGMKILLKKAEFLHLEELKGVQHVVHELDDGEGFPQLKRLHVEDCHEILHIVGPVGGIRCNKVFPLLESLSLHKLINLQTICDSQLTEDQSFSNLRIMKVANCDKLKHLFSIVFCNNLTKVTVNDCRRLKYLFSHSMVNSLLQLDHLEIVDCESMEGIFDASGLGRDEGKLIELMVFPKLRSLILIGLPNLDSVVEFPSLLKLEISFCYRLRFISKSSLEDNIRAEMQPQPLFDEKVRFPNLEELSISWMDELRKIWHLQLASESFSKLKKLHIDNCHDLMNIFPPSVGIPRSLVNLRVSGCGKMEEIIGHGEEEVTENRIVFNELKYLELDYLRRLTSFCSENFTLEFPSLERVSITHCQNMKTFSQGILSTPKLYKVQVNELCLWEGDLNSTIQKCYEEMVGFCDLEILTLSHFSRLREVWQCQALPVSFFNNLHILVVDDCTNMPSAIPANLLRFLNNLERLEVRNCDSLEEVLHFEDLINANEEHVGQLFPKLWDLKLIDLPKLKRFCNFTENIIELPMLLGLAIENCPNMETFVSNSTSVLQMSADNKEPHQKITSEENFNFLLADHIQPLFDDKLTFPNLHTLKLSRLPKVLHLWKENAKSNNVFSNLSTLSTSESLVNLGIMKIADCKMVEEIIQSHIGEEAKDCIIFKKLKHLELDDLPRLTSFCSENFTLEFPSLERVSITRCPSMETFSQGNLSTPKLDKVQVIHNRTVFIHRVEDKWCRWEGDLNSTIQKCYEEMVGFRDLEILTHSHFPCLREILHGQTLPVGFFNNLRILKVDDYTNKSSAIPANLLRCLNKLDWLVVSNCDSLEEVLHFEEPINADEEHFGQLFPALSHLQLINLPKLKRFSNSTSVLQVSADNKEPHQKITSEENFLLADCIQPLFDDKVAFPKLRWLKLSRLPSVLQLWKENAESNEVFTNLESLKISECSKLQKLVPSSWHLENLWRLEVSKCHGLINLSTLSTSESIVNLERMKIADCKMVEEIIQSKVGEEAKDCIVFRNLWSLGLDCLPSLTSFCSGNYALEFPYLKQVLVRQCPKMKIFSQGVVETPNLNKVKLTEEEKDDDQEEYDDEEDDDDDGCWEGNLNDTIQKLFNEMNSKDQD